MRLSPDLREFVALLNSASVRYRVVGGHAVAYHGYPRYTGDIDFLIEASLENSERLEKALHDFGFGGIGVGREDFLEPGIVVQLGRPPNRIVLLTSIDGVTFAEAWANRVRAELDGIPVFLIGKAELVRNKLAAGRAQDLADAERIQDLPD